MKKIISSILIIILLFTVVGCKNKTTTVVNTTDESMDRYTYTEGIHKFKVEDVSNKYIVKNGETEFFIVKPTDTSSVFNSMGSLNV